MHIVMHDYSGHPFQVQLSRELARRGHQVRHQYCSSYTTGRGAVERAPEDPRSFSVEPLCMASEFARYSPLRRILQEFRYGASLARGLRCSPPQVVVMCNIPLLAHAVAAVMLRISGIAMVFWQQDVYSDAIGTAVRVRLGRRVGGALAWIADRVECHIARSSVRVIPISQRFTDVLRRWNVPPDVVTTIPNWAALPEMPRRPRDNAWAHRHDLVGRNVVLYSGTLGLKHDPQIFLDLASALGEHDPDARVVVISEGQGRALLEEERDRLQLNNLMLFDYQPYSSLPNVLASGDVLITVLQPDASRYSVPSKVLNYLCAARPVIGIMPAENEAADTLLMSGAGVVVSPDDRGTAVTRLLDLLAAPKRRDEMGAAGRRYAEEAFDIAAIGARFESVLCDAVEPDSNDRLVATPRAAA
jgi:colanic acid biosynthesis glycosyl transferase WcaI